MERIVVLIPCLLLALACSPGTMNMSSGGPTSGVEDCIDNQTEIPNMRAWLDSNPEFTGEPLQVAIDKFNAENIEQQRGLGQPPLTVDELVLSIRTSNELRICVSDTVRDIYYQIAERQVLPDIAYLSPTTGLQRSTSDRVEVWWIDLSIQTGSFGYTFRVRDTWLSGH